MSLRYASIENIAKRLASRIKVVTNPSTSVLGLTGTAIGTDLIEIAAVALEEFVDAYLSMVYEMPLRHKHPYLNAIVEKLIVADVYMSYFPSQAETNEGSESFASVLRQQALNEFQGLFDGLGIFIPGSTNSSNSVQNDETRAQMSAKAMILPGEKLKRMIGYDFDGDNISDTDLFKLNSNVPPSFYTTGDFEDETADAVINNVRVRPRDYRIDEEHISFW